MRARRDLEKHLPDGYYLGHPRASGSGSHVQKIGKGAGHYYVMTPDDVPLRDGRGMPIKVGGTPSGREVRNEVARIRRALREREQGEDAAPAC